MKGFKILSILVLFLVGALAASATVNIDEVDIDGSDYELGDIVQLDKGEEFEIKVTLENTGNSTQEDIQVEAYIRGYDHDNVVQGISNVFNLNAGRKATHELNLDVPANLERDNYRLFIKVYNRIEELDDKHFKLDFTSAVVSTHLLDIRRIIASPEEVLPGRALISTLRINNRGTNDEEDVLVTASIPELGVKDSEYIDEIEAECSAEADDDCDDSTSSEELLLRIPKTAEPGEYTLKGIVSYDDGDETETLTKSITVLEGETAASDSEEQTSKTIIAVPDVAQDVTVGAAGTVYPITISNTGKESKTYVINVDGAEWADFKVSPSNMVVLKPGESKAVFVYVSANENAVEGENTFAATIKSGDKTLKQIAMKANVVVPEETAAEGEEMSLRKALEIGLIVLVVILVILGLIIGFNKLKGNEEEGEEDQTYY